MNQYAQLPIRSGGTRHYSLAKNLLSLGWESSIIAGSTELHTGSQQLPKGLKGDVQRCDGITFKRVHTPAYQGNGIGRIKSMLTYSATVLRKNVTRDLSRPDVILGSSVHPFAVWSASRLALRFRVPFIFEIRDLWPETLIAMGRIRRHGPIAFGMRILERRLLCAASHVVVLLPQAGNYLRPLGVSEGKISWIPNGVDLAGYGEPTEPSEKSTFTFMYFGGLTQATGLTCLVDACDRLRSIGASHLRVRVVGDGPMKSSLVSHAKRLGLDNIVLKLRSQRGKSPGWRQRQMHL